MLKSSFTNIMTSLKLDKISICYDEPNPENVKATQSILLHESMTKNWPGMMTKPGSRYHVRTVIRLPFDTAIPDRATALFDAGPKTLGQPSYRLEFNPARLSDQGWKDLWVFLETTVDPTPSEFMNNGRVTRIDLAVDLPGLDVASVIVQTTKKKKVGVYSDQSGEPQTVYLGAPTGKNRVVAYTKTDKATGLKSVRVECRVNPKCHGSDLHGIANPFASLSLVPTSVLDGIDLGMPPVFLADSVRLRGLARALRLLPQGKRKLVEYALVSGEALLPDADDIWLEFPAVLAAAGFKSVS